MSARTRYIYALAAALGLFCAQDAAGQIRGSERGSTRQVLDGTTITVDYARPTARGRELFGALVPWNVTWTPGANWATTLEADKDIRINGVDVQAGAYSVWMTPRQGAWTLTLNENTQLYHFQKPDTSTGRYNIEVHAEEAGHVEMLTWSFPSVSGDAAVLALNWGTTRVPMDIMVEPSKPVILDGQERAAYLGEYELEVLPLPGWPQAARMRITEAADGMLRAWMSFPIHPDDALEFDLIPAGLNRFNPGLYQRGELHNIEMGVAFEFEVTDRAVAVVMRGIEGTPFAQGARAAEQVSSR